MQRTYTQLVLVAIMMSAILGPGAASADTSSTALPDLIVAGVTYSPASPTQGQWVKAQVVIKNQGAGQALFRVGQAVLSVKPFGGAVNAAQDFIIPAGGSQTYSLDVINPYDNRAPGTYSLAYTVNPGTVVSETVTGNNSATYPLTLAVSQVPVTTPTVDLAIESVRVDPAQGTTSTDFTFTVLIKNCGTTAAKVENVHYQVPNDQPWGFQNDSPRLTFWLNPGQTCEYKGKPYDLKRPIGKLPGGLLDIIFTVNPYDQGDVNRNNNSRICQVAVVDPAIGSVGRPVLYLLNPSVIPATTVKVGEVVKVVGNVTNRGDGAALIPKGTVLLNVAESGRVLAAGGWSTDSDTTLPGNGSRTLPIWLTLANLAPGVHNLLLTVDPNNVVQEKDETHHQAILPVTVIGPDLAVSAVRATSGTNPSTREGIPLEVGVKNLGPMPAVFPAGSTLLYYGAQGFSTNKMTLSAPLQLAPGQEQRTTITVPAFTPNPGNYTLMVQVDPTNSMGDPNQINNRVTLPITLVAPRITPGAPAGTSAPGALPKALPQEPLPVKPGETTLPPIKAPGPQNTVTPR